MNTFPVRRNASVLCILGMLIAVASWWADRALATREGTARIEAAERMIAGASAQGIIGACAGDRGETYIISKLPRSSPMLATWQTIAGCGAGASSGTGGGIKWVGRNVTGGLFQAQCQASYVRLDDGYNYVVNTLINTKLGDKWSLGVNLPWLYKYWRDPYGVGFDLSNEGLGDTNVLLTRRLGSINATSLTLSAGIPTGKHQAENRGARLRQDKQMGHGKLTGGLILDHTFDNTWGPAVIGATADYRGGENEFKNYRAPSASTYAYAGYLLGPFVPVAGLTVTGIRAQDRNDDRDQPMPLLTVAANASIEWSTSTFALLVGASLPFDVKGNLQPWTAGLGLSISPF